MKGTPFTHLDKKRWVKVLKDSITFPNIIQISKTIYKSTIYTFIHGMIFFKR